jgi:probable F420-dependent oxidoreductase
MRVGAVLPQIEIGGDVAAVRAFVAATDELGFDHVLGYDHVLGAVHADRDPPLEGPYTEDDPFHDPLVLFAHLAALHPRLEYVTGILILPQRQTALVARQAADLAMLAPGGVRLGVAVGWNWTEYDALGQDFGTRGARLDEQIPLLRELWAGGVVTGTVGERERLDRMALVPAPAHAPTLWVGGFSEPAYRRGVRLGDGFVFAGPTERVLSGWEHVCGLLDDAGRAVDEFGADWCLRGTTAEGVADRVATWEEAGGSHASVITLGLGFPDVDAHIAHLQAVAEALDLRAD